MRGQVESQTPSPSAYFGVDGLQSQGPGNELESMFGELQEQVRTLLNISIVIPSDCTCPKMRARMNNLGPKGCQDNREEFLAGIRENVKLLADVPEMAKMLILESIPALFDEAVRRSEAKLVELKSQPRPPRRVLRGLVSKKGCCGGGTAVTETKMIWSYGVTTVPSRKDTLLPRTLASLAAAGFDQPRLFVDGCDELQNWRRWFGLDATCRYPKAGVAANWILGLAELVQREPNADRFAIFQDDCVTYKNLRQYLEKVPYPDKSYLNLITEYENEDKARNRSGWFEAVQLGRGAVGLVFSREAAALLLSERGFVERAQDKKRGKIAIDGGILYAMQKQGWKEYCHAPSLVQHIGHNASTMGHSIPQAKTFKGEDFDALDLLQ